jgi:ATP-dependent helicase HepA
VFEKGDQVVERGSMGSVGTIVSGPAVHGGESYYRVNFNGRAKNVLQDDLESFAGDLDPESMLRAGRFGDHVAFARRLTMSKLRRPLRDAVYSYKASRTEFHAYQFKPLLKFLASERRRLLIADEVGLGKTIEAGYILQEERARFGIQRVLVVCPAALRTKWQNELWQRFGEEFEVFDRKSFLSKVLLKAGEKDRGLPRLQGIVSLQSLRSNNVIEAVEERGAPLDLLIVDEAHHCRNSDTKQYRVVRALGDVSDASVFLTATPVHLGDENLFNLFRLLLPEDFDRFDVFQERLYANQHVVEAEVALRRGGYGWEQRALEALGALERTLHGGHFRRNPLYREAIDTLRAGAVNDNRQLVDLQENLAQLNMLSPVMTRTRKREVYPDAAKREAHVLRVDMSVQEQEVYRRLSEYCFRLYANVKGDFAARFAVITLQRQLSSCLHAAIEHYCEKGGGEVLDDELDGDDGEEPVGGENGNEREGGVNVASEPGFLELVRECRTLLPATDAKLASLLTMLREQDKVVVFSYFKRSLRYMERALNAAGIGCVRIDGDVAASPHDPDNDERLQRIRRFRDDPGVRVLLSSEVGSEGLDFQFCNVVVNWDLPWNPMVVEQRIGRLDRLGQRAEKILIFSFSCPGTIEDLILTRLYSRIGVFERTIGVLEPILGQEIRELTDRLFDATLRPDEREAIIEQRAKALAQRARDEERLESEAANLVGQDEFFNEQIERVRRLGRFVTGEELRLMVTEFLQSEHPACAPVERQGDDSETGSAAPSGVWRVKVNEALREFVRKPLARNDPALIRFLDRGQHGHVDMTFDNEVALRNPAVELVNATHPLVRAIAKHYDDHPTLVHPVTAVEVNCDVVPPGEYLFVWASVEETGIRGGRALWAVAVSADGTQLPDAEATEALLHQMVVVGRRWESFEVPPAEFTAALLDRAIESLVERHQRYRCDRKKHNLALVEQRLASLEASFRAKRAERQRRLDETRLRGKERGVALFEAQLRKLESDCDESRRKTEQAKEVSVSWSMEGAGYVRVVE